MLFNKDKKLKEKQLEEYLNVNIALHALAEVLADNFDGTTEDWIGWALEKAENTSEEQNDL